MFFWCGILILVFVVSIRGVYWFVLVCGCDCFLVDALELFLCVFICFCRILFYVVVIDENFFRWFKVMVLYGFIVMIFLGEAVFFFIIF